MRTREIQRQYQYHHLNSANMRIGILQRENATKTRILLMEMGCQKRDIAHTLQLYSHGSQKHNSLISWLFLEWLAFSRHTRHLVQLNTIGIFSDSCYFYCYAVGDGKKELEQRPDVCAVCAECAHMGQAYKASPCKAWQPNGWNRHGNGFTSAPEKEEQTYWQSARRENIRFDMQDARLRDGRCESLSALGRGSLKEKRSQPPPST